MAEEAPTAAQEAEIPNAISRMVNSDKKPTKGGDKHEDHQSEEKQVSAWPEIGFVFRVWWIFIVTGNHAAPTRRLNFKR